MISNALSTENWPHWPNIQKDDLLLSLLLDEEMYTVDSDNLDETCTLP